MDAMTVEDVQACALRCADHIQRLWHLRHYRLERFWIREYMLELRIAQDELQFGTIEVVEPWSST